MYATMTPKKLGKMPRIGQLCEAIGWWLLVNVKWLRWHNMNLLADN